MSNDSTFKVMIVDDSAVVRQTMKEILSADSQIDVIATAADPLIAAKKLESTIPDAIVLDIEMPRMDGLTFLRRLMKTHPIPVVICSSKSEEGSQNAIKALEYGAVEIIQKPKMGTRQFIEESRVTLCDAVKAAALTKVKKKVIQEPAPRQVAPKLTADAVLPPGAKPLHIDTTDKIIVVGASTGGTEALREFIEQLPVDCPGVAIVQHMPEHFTAAFSKRLDSLAKVKVKEAQNNDSVLRGHVLIAPGNHHMLVKRSGARYFVEVREGPLVSRHRPSVDVLFRSAARYVGKNCIGVIMTGMGDDGARGMKEMHDAGAFNIAQDEASCVVFGMPNEAIKRGGVHEIMPLQKIASRVLERGKRG